MLKKKKNDLRWLEFELLQCFPEVKHAIFLNPPLGEKTFLENSEKALEVLQLKECARLIQCHGGEVHEVAQGGLFENYDALMTAKKEVGLLIRHADCQAALLYDPIHHVLANVHCGWRGSVLNLYGKVIAKMNERYGSQAEDLIVCIGPSLGPEAAEFKHYQSELPETFWPFQVKPLYFDFWEISRMQLEQAGVPEEQIEIAEICTFASEKECFSYRRNKNTFHHGTLAAIV